MTDNLSAVRLSMAHEFSIDPHTGAVSFTGFSIVLFPGESRENVATALFGLPGTSQDHGNGYAWLHFQGLSFGGKPAGVSVGFYQGLLREIHWGVDLRPAGAHQYSWPSREESDQEIAFVRTVLRDSLSRPFTSGEERFPWGVVWSLFDGRGVEASAGLRYNSPA